MLNVYEMTIIYKKIIINVNKMTNIYKKIQIR